MVTKAFRLLSCALLLVAVAGAQTAPPPAPDPQPQATQAGAYDWWARAGVTCAAGASASVGTAKPTVQCGALAGFPFFDLEFGVMGPQARQSNVSGYLSTNFWVPLIAATRLGNARGVPLIVGGYTRMFETGHALDYGLAFARPLDASHSLQFEVRDYWEISNAHQHNVVLRVVWLVGLPD
ncbi:MAG TPA: hypothetical protein VHX60_17810 [Acidobacteriaceae bacterium]|jgi:hypothetical protein|nr:hypothetical protein [Acidobacteriaceae bacterium]